jgi:predicted anti-sigma-YlaC factor YlaD
MRNAHKERLVPAHLTETQMVAYLDGELPASEQAMARSHLENCWTCRSRVNAIEYSIEAFLGSRTTVLPEESSFSSNRVEQFRQRLERHSAESSNVVSVGGQVSLLGTRLRQAAAGLLAYRQAVIAATVAVCLVILMFTDVWDTRVSADTVLSRAQTYESGHLPTAGEVTRTSVQVERIDPFTGVTTRLGTITVLRDSATPETFLQAESSTGQAVQGTVHMDRLLPGRVVRTVLSGSADASLGAYLASQQWVPDVSVSGFRQLIAPRGATAGSARRAGNEFQVRYPFSPGHVSGIAEARLSVDAKNWQPTSMSLVTSNRGSEYRFTRTSFVAEPRTTEIAEMFQPREFEKRTGSPLPELPPARKPTPLSYADTRATEDEVAAAEALHKVDACLGEEVYLFPMSDGTLLVQGLVDTAARRQAIRQSLKDWGGPLRVEIFLPRELRNGSALFNAPDHSGDGVPPAALAGPDVVASAATARMPMYNRLYQHFLKPGMSSGDTQQQIAVFSNQVVTLARQTFLHAWALKKLDAEFSPERVVGLPGWAVATVEQMRQDHRHSIASLAKRQAEMLSSIASPIMAAGVSDAATGLDSEALLRLAQQQNELVRSLFTTSEQPQAPDASLGQLMALLRSMGS